LFRPWSLHRLSCSSDPTRAFVVDDTYVAAEVAHDEAAMRRMVDDRFAFNPPRLAQQLLLVADGQTLIDAATQQALDGRAATPKIRAQVLRAASRPCRSTL
jgi:hypothetical protein